jgi:dienelactone hydrolase
VSSTFDSGEEFVPPKLDYADLEGYIVTTQSRTGAPVGIIVKQAILGLQSLYRSTDRWQRLEMGYRPIAPLWLEVTERDKLLDMLRGQKSVEARALRQALQEMFP